MDRYVGEILHERLERLKEDQADMEEKMDGLLDAVGELAREQAAIKKSQSWYRTILHIVGWVLTGLGNVLFWMMQQGIIQIQPPG